MDSTGKLSFQITTSEARLPIEGAVVIVRQQPPENKLIAIRTTDRSGKTDEISIDTPDVSLGLTPENAIQPWTGLSAIIDHPGYERVILDGLQIFPGITTTQQVNLIPLQRFDQNMEEEQEYNITPQPLWEGINHD